MSSKEATHVHSETHHASSAPQVETRREAEVERAPETAADYWLHLQQTVGNQAVGRMLAQSATPSEPVAVQREDEEGWKFKPLPPSLTYNPAGPFNMELSPGGLDVGYNKLHAAGGGSPLTSSNTRYPYAGTSPAMNLTRRLGRSSRTNG